MATTMTLGGVSLGNYFPTFGRSFGRNGDGDQGGGFFRVTITLEGHVEADGGTDEVMALFQTMKATGVQNDTTFSYVQDSVTVYSNQHVWIESYNEPVDEFGKVASGYYSIQFYYFEKKDNLLGIGASYGSYVFTDPPKWGRDFYKNRQEPFTPYSNLATISVVKLSGHLFDDTHAGLMAKIEALQTAFLLPALLTYGVWAKTCYPHSNCQIVEDVMRNYAYWSVTLYCYEGEAIEFSFKQGFSRIHYNPIITEKPFCDDREIELLGRSGQTVTYQMTVKAVTIQKARDILNEQLWYAVEPGGTEMQGGNEDWDYDTCSVSCRVVKFHKIPILENSGP